MIMHDVMNDKVNRKRHMTLIQTYQVCHIPVKRLTNQNKGRNDVIRTWDSHWSLSMARAPFKSESLERA